MRAIESEEHGLFIVHFAIVRVDWLVRYHLLLAHIGFRMAVVIFKTIYETLAYKNVQMKWEEMEWKAMRQ